MQILDAILRIYQWMARVGLKESVLLAHVDKENDDKKMILFVKTII